MEIRIQKPSDQPTGEWRLLDDLEAGLASGSYTVLRMVVAFARAAPILKLLQTIRAFRSSGGRVMAVFGLDQHGTTQEALAVALREFDEVRVAKASGRLSATFHPKVFLFQGPHAAEVAIGSNNLTVGGTELNPESLLRIRLQLPQEASILQQARDVWDDAYTNSLELTEDLLAALVQDGIVISEAQASAASGRKVYSGSGRDGAAALFPVVHQTPPRPLPKASQRAATGRAQAQGAAPYVGSATALVIQVIPHHNGEIFLSKTAVNQHPEFFGWPFTGKTTPKIANNPAYPQREPDPAVMIDVFDGSGTGVLQGIRHELNTVYYSTKSEIRVTVPPEVVRVTPEYSVLVMAAAEGDESLDYRMTFYAPGSAEYDAYLSVCNQTMPSGGKPTPRKFGWL